MTDVEFSELEQENTKSLTGVATGQGALLRYPADRRALVWALGLFPCPAVVSFLAPSCWPWLFPAALYLGFCAGVLAHCHSHLPVFRQRRLNASYSMWLSVFYGFPLIAWIPTHNMNHHRYTNGEGDATRTSKMGKDGLGKALLYPLRSSVWQWAALRIYLQKVWRKGGFRAHEPWLQMSAVVFVHAALLFGATQTSHETVVSLLMLVTLPALLAPWFMMFVNYLQHVGCDALSPDRHSRDFVGELENWFVFNAGLHTVHHERPSTHWSEYPALHRYRCRDLDVGLLERNIPFFLLRRYFLK